MGKACREGVDCRVGVKLGIGPPIVDGERNAIVRGHVAGGCQCMVLDDVKVLREYVVQQDEAALDDIIVYVHVSSMKPSSSFG